MKKLFLPLFLFITTSNVFASAKVCIKNGELEVFSNLIFYGNKAAESGPGCAKEIHHMFNQPDAHVEVNGKKLKVKFKVSYQIEQEDAAFSSVNINKRVENNYIRIENKTNNEPNGRSNHNLAGNCGFYAHADNLGSSTTCAHEYAHGLGLIHYNERKSGYGSNGDLRGKGDPGIMAARGYLVDQKFQWNSNVKAGEAGGTINPKFRKVRKEDIEDLNLHKLTFDKKGCAELGAVHGMAYTEDGKVTRGDKSYLTDALKYLGRRVIGDLGKPSLCE
jgi:hypothetical protein